MTVTLAEALEPWFVAYVEHAVNLSTVGAPKDMPEILRVTNCGEPG